MHEPRADALAARPRAVVRLPVHGREPRGDLAEGDGDRDVGVRLRRARFGRVREPEMLPAPLEPDVHAEILLDEVLQQVRAAVALAVEREARRVARARRGGGCGGEEEQPAHPHFLGHHRRMRRTRGQPARAVPQNLVCLEAAAVGLMVFTNFSCVRGLVPLAGYLA